MYIVKKHKFNKNSYIIMCLDKVERFVFDLVYNDPCLFQYKTIMLITCIRNSYRYSKQLKKYL